jgi:hypothetical protein
MELQTLQQELATRAIVLSLDAMGKLKYKGPKGAMVPELLEAMKEHRAELLASIAEQTQGTSPTRKPPTLRTERDKRHWPCRKELALWNSYYKSCDWYTGPYHDGVITVHFEMALEYATDGAYGLCWALASNRLIWYYEECQEAEIDTLQGPQRADPRQFTELLRSACQAKDILALAALASNFHNQPSQDEVVRKADASFNPQPLLTNGDTETERQDSAEDSQEVATELEQPATIAKKGLAIIYADVHAGRAMTETGVVLDFAPGSSLSTILRLIQDAGHACDRLYICGDLPDGYETWLLDTEMWKIYTTGKRGHYFDREKAAYHVARYQHRATGDEIEVRTAYSWFGDVEYSVHQAVAAMDLLNQNLKAAFREATRTDVHAYATPALTFQSCWQLLNRLEHKKFELLSRETRTTIHSSSGQGRVECCTVDSLGKITDAYYYDGIFMYSALTWGMPTEIELRDNQNIYAGKVPARYRIRYTIPSNWQHIGLFMTPKEKVTGNPRDSEAWSYPGEKYQRQTFETWADGAELDVAYNLPDGMPAWDITILERIVFKSEKDSSVKKPLDAITARLTKMREKVEADASQDQDSDRIAIYALVRGMIRNILLHGIGSFHRNVRDTTYILQLDEPAPDNYVSARPVGDNLIWYTVPQQTESYTQQFEHPEWPALIWARCRARMTKAALSLPRETLLAIRTDAIAVTTEQPQWKANEKRGALRQKWHIARSLKAPHSLEELDAIVRKYVKEDR